MQGDVNDNMNGVDLLHLEIVKALDRGATIVTGNQRAARALRHAFDLRNRRHGIASWQPAAVFAWDTWITTLWRRLLIDGHTSRLLLSRLQEITIWRGILEADNETQSLQSKDALAELAADAWQRLCSYNGQGKLRGAAASPDSMAFERWAIEFHRRCRDNGFLAQAELDDALTSAAKNGHLRLEASEVALLGFDRLTPAQTVLLESINSIGCTVTELRPVIPAERRLLVSAKDEEDEIAAAARWARRFLDERPEARIAVVHPNIEKHRARIDSIFREVLAPELENIAAPEEKCPYEFSLGIPLAQTLMVRTALDLLHWIKAPLSIDRASALLLSPYFALQSGERGVRAEFDAYQLRRAHRLRPEVSLDWMSAAVYKSQYREKFGRLASGLHSLRSAASRLNLSTQRLHAEWAEAMRQLLATAHWGTEHQTSVEFQIHRKWEAALDELAALDFDDSKTEFYGALNSLERITAQTMFAPESHNAPVQVMGVFEAAGVQFDAVWLMCAGDLNWPVPASTNPLLPWRLQRELVMPGSDITADSKIARQVTERIAASSPTTIVSYAVETPEGKQRPSPLLDALGLSEVEVQQIAPPEPARAIAGLESLDDSERIQPLPDTVVHGGAQILKNQAACPFRAFAEHRLWSTEIEQPESGMDARQNGNAIHRVLELFWNNVETQQALKEMTPNERIAVLDDCIRQCLAKIEAHSETSWDVAYMRMQRDRLRRLLMHWLELELLRPPFKVELSEKNLSDVRVGPLSLNVRVDRIDSTANGEVLIDYKTGSTSPKDWLTERPDEPQLPLYATLADSERLQGVAFGLVRAGEKRDLIGFASHDDMLPSRRQMAFGSMEEQIDDWKRILNNLAMDFSAGDARVDPKTYPKTCKHCTQRILCRLNPSQAQEDEDTAEVTLG